MEPADVDFLTRTLRYFMSVWVSHDFLSVYNDTFQTEVVKGCSKEYSQGCSSESVNRKKRERPKYRGEVTSKDWEDSEVFALIETWSGMD